MVRVHRTFNSVGCEFESHRNYSLFELGFGWMKMIKKIMDAIFFLNPINL